MAGWMASAWAGGLGDFNTCLEGTRHPDAKYIPYCTRAIAMLRKAGKTDDEPVYQKALRATTARAAAAETG